MFDELILDLNAGDISEPTKVCLFTDQISNSVQLSDIVKQYGIDTQKGLYARSFEKLREEVGLYFTIKRKLTITKKYKENRMQGSAFSAN